MSAVTELFQGTVHIHTLKWDFHFSHDVPIHPFAAHDPQTGLIQYEHITLYFHTSVSSPPLQDDVFLPHYMLKYFLFFRVGEGPSHFLRLV